MTPINVFSIATYITRVTVQTVFSAYYSKKDLQPKYTRESFSDNFWNSLSQKEQEDILAYPTKEYAPLTRKEGAVLGFTAAMIGCLASSIFKYIGSQTSFGKAILSLPVSRNLSLFCSVAYVAFVFFQWMVYSVLSTGICKESRHIPRLNGKEFAQTAKVQFGMFAFGVCASGIIQGLIALRFNHYGIELKLPLPSCMYVV